MRRKITWLCCLASLSIWMEGSAFGQVRGGAGRGLGAAASNAAAAAGQGLATATQAASQAGVNGYSRVTPSSNLSASSGGVHATPASVGLGKPVSTGGASGVQLGGLPRKMSQAGGAAAGVGRSPVGYYPFREANTGALSQSGPTVQGATAPENWYRIQQQRDQRADQLRALSEQNANSQLLATADRMNVSAANHSELQQAGEPPVTARQTTASGRQNADAAGATTRSLPEQKKGFWFRSR
jgi:hypothetical protein